MQFRLGFPGREGPTARPRGAGTLWPHAQAALQHRGKCIQEPSLP